MSSRFANGWIFVCLACAVTLPAFAQERTFASLLARAEAQAAAGHRWSPPGDNVTETVADMMEFISSATPEQLTKLAALLDDPPPAPPSTPKNGLQTAIAPAAPTPSVAPAPPVAPAMPPSAARVPPASPPSLSPPPLPAPAPVVMPPAQSPPAPVPLAAARIPPVLTPAPAPAQTPVALSPVPSAAPAPAPKVMETAAAVPIQPLAKPGIALSPTLGARAKELLARGQAAERLGDVSGARRFYTTAAQQGDATAARSLGRLYDPAHLQRTAMGGIDPNPDLARYWYEQAVVLGDIEAGPLLNALSVR